MFSSPLKIIAISACDNPFNTALCSRETLSETAAAAAAAAASSFSFSSSPSHDGAAQLMFIFLRLTFFLTVVLCPDRWYILEATLILDAGTRIGSGVNEVIMLKRSSGRLVSLSLNNDMNEFFLMHVSTDNE